MRKSYSSKEEKTAGWLLGGVSASLTFSLIIWYLGSPQLFLEHRLGINALAFNSLSPWLLSILIIFGYIWYTIKAIPFVQSHLLTFSWLKVIGIWSAFVLSTMEEVVFRQMLMDWFLNLNMGTLFQILGSAIVFGISHGVWILLRGDRDIALPVILSTTILGSLLAILYIIADRNILVPIITHIVINLFIEPWLILSSITGKWKN